MEGAVGHEHQLVLEDVRVAGEYDAVGETRESRSKSVGELAAPAVAHMENFLRRR